MYNLQLTVAGNEVINDQYTDTHTLTDDFNRWEQNLYSAGYKYVGYLFGNGYNQQLVVSHLGNSLVKFGTLATLTITER